MHKLLHKLLLLLVLFSPHVLNAQNWQWAKNYGGGIGTTSDAGEPRKIATDSFGNSYVTGQFAGVASFGELVLTSKGDRDVFIAKYDNAGNVLWAKSAGGIGSDIGQDITVDASGNTYVVGNFYESATFGTTTITSSGSSDVFIAKYDVDGNLMWTRKAGGSEHDEGQQISLDGSGNVYISGIFSGSSVFGSTNLASVGPNDIFLSKLDISGNILWTRQAGSAEGENTAFMDVDDAGNSYIAGMYQNVAITFGNIQVSRPAGTGTYLSKYDTNGNVLWAKDATAGTGFVYVAGISIDATGNSYLTGRFSSSPSFGATTLSSGTLFLAKFSTSGNALWADAISSNFANIKDITTDASGNSYLTGDFYSSTIAFDNIVLTRNSSGFRDMFVIKCNSAGSVLWAKSAGGTNFTYPSSVAVDAGGNSYIAGYFEGTTTFGTNTLTASSSGSHNIFSLKLDTSGNTVWAKSAGGTGTDEGSDIASDPEGNTYTTGFFAGTATFGSVTLTSSGSEDIFVAKHNAVGNVIWAVKAGGIGPDRGVSINIDTEGNTYVTGTFTGTATFGSTSLTSTGAYHDLFIAKYDANGNFLWARSAGGNYHEYVRGISVDASGSIFITGTYVREMTFGSTSLIGYVDDGVNYYGGNNMFIAKYDTNGNLVWATQPDKISNGFSRGYAITADAIGNSYVIGHFNQTTKFGSTVLTSNGSYDIFLVKYDPSGNVVWTKSVGSEGTEYGQGIAMDASGNIYMTGNFYDNAVFGTTTLTNNGTSDIFLVKFSSDGNVIWAKNAGGEDYDFGHAIATDAEGNSYISGSLRGATAFGSVVLPTIGAGTSSYVAKYDTEGNVIWAQKPNSGSSYGRGIAIDAAGNSYVTGTTSGTNTYNSTTLNGARDVLIAKLGSTTIATGTLASSYCGGEQVSVPFTTTGTFSQGNTFTVQLTDATGSFAAPVSIGSGTASPILATLPASASGSGYRIRVVAAAPQTTGSDNGTDITINPASAAPTVASAERCGSGAVTLSASGAPAGGSYRWYAVATGGTAIATSPTYTTPVLTTSTTYYVSAVSSTGCESTRTAVEAMVTTQVTNNTVGQDREVCYGQPAPAIAGSVPAGGTGSFAFQWQRSTDGVNFTTISGATSIDYAPGVLQAQETWFRRVVTSGDCQSVSAAVKVTVNPNPARSNIRQEGTLLIADVAGAQYEWTLDGKPFEGTTQSVHVSAPGKYAVRVKSASGCYSEFSEQFEPAVTPTSLAEAADKLGLTVFPNPTRGKVTLAASKPLKRVTLEIMTVAGLTIHRERLAELADKHEMSLEQLPTGVYLLRVATDGGSTVHRLFVTE